MNFDEYQKASQTTRQITMPIIYPALGLAGEVGEVMNQIKKIYRDNDGKLLSYRREAIASELGDLLWYIASLCVDLNLSMDTIAQLNITKLADRYNRGVIKGDGGDR